MRMVVLYFMHRTGYHVVDNSPWPLAVALRLFGLTSGLVRWVHRGDLVLFWFLYAFVVLVLTLVRWWRDVVVEGVYMGCHTGYVVRGFRIGIILFILSEGAFFATFFWRFAYYTVGEWSAFSVWPPLGVEYINPWKVPLLNTALLLGSGVRVTWAHKAVVIINSAKFEDSEWWRIQTFLGLSITIMLGLCFTFVQGYEYYYCSFTMADGVYGSCFFLMTGFHGMHVIAGTIFLSVNLVRVFFYHFAEYHNYFGFDAAVWYWHFVDVIWILLFFVVYIWPVTPLN